MTAQRVEVQSIATHALLLDVRRLFFRSLHFASGERTVPLAELSSVVACSFASPKQNDPKANHCLRSNDEIESDVKR